MALDETPIDLRPSFVRVVAVMLAGTDRSAAVAALLRDLPADAAALALMPPEGIERLQALLGTDLETARDGVALQPGRMLAAPPDAIVAARGGRLRVSRDMVDEGGADRLDRLLASLTDPPGPRVVFLRLGAASVPAPDARSAEALRAAGGRIVVEGDDDDPWARVADLRGSVETALTAARGYLEPESPTAPAPDPAEERARAGGATGPLGRDVALDALSRRLTGLARAAAADGRALRLWVQGCAKPELPYAAAIRALEAVAELGDVPAAPEVIVTDADRGRLARARAGTFPPELAGRADPARLAQHFRPSKDGWAPHCALRSRLSFVRSEGGAIPALARMDAVIRTGTGGEASLEARHAAVAAAHSALVEDGLLLIPRGDAPPPAALFAPDEDGGPCWRRVGPPAEPGHDAAGLALELAAIRSEMGEIGRMLRGTLDDLQNLVTSTGLAAVILDDALRVVRATDASGRLLRLDIGDVGRPVVETAIPDVDPDLIDEAVRVLARHAPAQTLLELDGRAYARRVLPYRTDGDRVRGVVVVFSDVTELRLRERAAEAARGYARALVQTTREPFAALDGTGRVVEVSAAFLESFGYDQGIVLNRPLREIDGGAWRAPALERALAGMEDDGAPVTGLRVEHDFGRTGRRRLLVNLRRTHGPDPAGPLVLMAIQDVTEQERQAERLTEQDARIAALTEAVGGAVLTVDAAGRIVEAGMAAALMFGHVPDALLGRPIDLVLPAETGGGVEAFRRALAAPGRRIAVEGRRADGVRLALDLAVDAMRADGRTLLTGVLHDLSAELVRQEELRRLRAMEAIGRLTGGVAHDFGNLLTVIDGNLAMIEATTLSERDGARLSEARDAVALGTQLTRQILSLGGGDGRAALAPTAVNVAAEAAADLARLSLRPGIALELRLSEAVGTVRADDAALRSALLNLMLNALDAMPAGGRLRLSTGTTVLTREDAALHSGVRAGAFAVLSVRDDGLGMSPDVRDRATEPFFTTKPAGEGTGLGLSTAYAFARHAGGFLTIESAPAQGTRVALHLPLAEPGNSMAGS
jgi:PAS domain S-box-containing protein